MRDALAQLVRGLGALHAAGHLHRDLKPGNVMVTDEGRVVILDFGVASETRPRGRTVTGGSELVGTPAYIAPEVGLGRGVREASDWYGVGVMIYEALAGRRPFTGDLRRVMAAKRMMDPARPSELVGGVPADLEELCLRLLRRDPAGRPTGAELARWFGSAIAGVVGPVTRAAPGLIGRDQPLTALDDAATRARDGALIVRVHGSSGMGKSALVSHFLARQRERESAVTLSGRCYLHESMPYKGLDSLIDALARHLLELPEPELVALAPPTLPALAHLFPVLRRLEGAVALAWVSLARPDPHELRRHAVDALRELLTRMAARAPLVLHIDDAQWGDAESASLLAEVLRAPASPPVLLVVSFRSEDEDSPFLRELPPGDALGIAITRLPLPQARALAVSWLAGAFGQPTAERIARESSGVPFLVEQMARHVLAHGDAVTLGDAVTAQLDALDADARALLSIIAAAGRPLAQRVALRAAALGPPGHAALDRLLAGRLVRTRGLDASALVECYHDRIREAAAPPGASPSGLNGDPDDAQRELHRRLARALIADESRDAEAIALHLDRAGEASRAGAYYLAAADHAAQQLAFVTAIAHYQRALVVAPLAGSAEAEVLVKLADAMCGAGQGAGAVAIYQRAAIAADPEVALQCYERAAEELLRTGHIDEGLRALRDFLPRVGLHLPEHPRLALASARLRLAIRGLGFRERPERALPPERLARLETCWSAAVHVCMTRYELGAVFQSWHALESLRAGHLDHGARAFALEATFRAALRWGGRATIERLHQRAAELSARSGNPHTSAFLRTTVAFTHAQGFLDGRLGRDLALEVIPALRVQGLWWYVDMMEWLVLFWSYYLGDLRSMCDRADQVSRDAERRGDLFGLACAVVSVPHIRWLLRGDLAGARDAVAETERVWHNEHYFVQHYWTLVAVVNLELYAGDGPTAWARVEHDIPRLRRASLHHTNYVRVEGGSVRGRAAIAAAVAGTRTRELLARADREGAKLAAGPSPFEQTLGTLQRACVAAARGDLDLAASLLREAVELADRAGMLNHAAVARTRLGALLGGDEGALLVREADAWLAGQGVVDRARWLAVHAPGF